MGIATTGLALAHTAGISVATLFDSMRRSLTSAQTDVRLRRWAERLVSDAQIDLDVSGPGLAHARTNASFVVMSNHASHYDIPVLFASLPGRMRMVAKAELFRVPIWGRAMLEAGFVRIDRKDRDAAIESLRQAAAHLAQGTRIWIAPEGTRSPDGSLQPFKKGGFHLAIDAGLPILPVAIAGTRAVLPARTAVVRRGCKVQVRVLEPIRPEPPVDALRARVHRALESALRELA